MPERKSRSRKSLTSPSNQLLQDDMTWMDMLDGTTMPTIGAAPTPPASSMSAQTDSIISLPPLDNRASRWNDLHSAVPPRLRRPRGGSLGGREIPKYLENRKRPPTRLVAIGPVRKPDRQDVRIDMTSQPVVAITSATPAGLASANISTGSNHNRTPSRVTPDEITNDIDEVSVRDPSTKFVNYGATGASSSTGVGGGGGGGGVVNSYNREDDELSTGNSSHNESVGRRLRRRTRQKRTMKRVEYEELNWDWRFPGNEDALMPSMAWIYLPVIGWLIFATAFVVNHGEMLVREYVISPIHVSAIATWGESSGLAVLCLVRAAIVLLSFAVVYKFSPLYGPGSGIPEMKCVLTGVFMPNALSGTTLASKMLGLSLATASGISVGKLGPFMHMSGMIASLVSKISVFKALNENPLFKLQALSAAMAAGVGATFGAPIGGVMLSIELMSAYYYIHWLPMSLFCSIMGYYLLMLFVETDSHVYFNPNVVISISGQPVWYVVVYCVLGVACGFVGYCLIRFTILMKKAISWVFSINQPRKVVAFLIAFVFLHTIIAQSVGGVLSVPQKVGVDTLFGASKADKYDWLNSTLQVQHNSWGSSFSLFLIMWIKFALTGVSLVLPIPAGTFMPIFQVGAFLGRAYGELLRGFSFFDWIDPRATAIVGAASLTSGTLHVTSIALVMLELTREAVNVLPITISVVCSYAVSKSLSSDLFSELIKFRRLPYILGLREQYPKETKWFHEEVSPVVAKAVMNGDFPFVTPRTTVREARRLLAEPWQVIAFVNHDKEKKLFGVIKRRDLVSVLNTIDGGGGYVGGSENEIGVSAAEEGALDHTRRAIGFLRDFDPTTGHRLVDMGVMQISVHTPFWKVITYFRMLSMNVIYVMTTNGSVAGVITKPLVIEHCIVIERQWKKRKLQERENARELRKGEIEARFRYGHSIRTDRRTARKMSYTNLAAMDAPSGRRSRNTSATFTLT